MILRIVTLTLFIATLFAQNAKADEEFNPFAADAEETLQAFDSAYENQTGESSRQVELFMAATEGCYQLSCPIFVDINKSTQTLSLYLDGQLSAQWAVSTGRPGYDTPNFNKRFDGRIYQRYDSSKYPGGDYKGLGNMPYAMFIYGGFAVHGTPSGNWKNLGRKASHGCIRIHPNNASYLNGLLRQVGVSNSWITVR